MHHNVFELKLQSESKTAFIIPWNFTQYFTGWEKQERSHSEKYHSKILRFGATVVAFHGSFYQRDIKPTPATVTSQILNPYYQEKI